MQNQYIWQIKNEMINMGNKSKVSDDQIISYLKEGHKVKETATHLHVDNGRVGQLARVHGLIKVHGLMKVTRISMSNDNPSPPQPITTTTNTDGFWLPPSDLDQHQMDNLQAAKNLMLNYLEKLEADRQILVVRCVLQQKVHIVQNYVQPYLTRLEMDIKLFMEMVNNL